MEYKASLDKTAIAITVGMSVLFAAVIGWQYVIVRDEGRADPIYITTACLLIYFMLYAFHPVGYIVTDEELIVRRPVGKVRLRRSEIRSVELLERRQIGGSIRTFGVDGLFGYYGRFANFTMGGMTWYATRRDRLVLVRTVAGQKIILTPDDREGFVAELQGRIGKTATPL